jgi:3-methyl-2-oxobutanoate hydroxymethyltransferase
MRLTVPQILDMAKRGERIAMVTAYDYPSAQLVDAAGVPIILVGDSVGSTVLGYGSTIPVTMDEMIHHAAAVVRGSSNALVVGDMPFMSYQALDSEALRNAGRFLKEAGCQAVKLEGGRTVASLVRKMTGYGIPVMSHIGLTPQSFNRIGGHRVQGRTAEQAKALLEDALALEAAGAFSVVLELLPAEVARLISERLEIPTIGIGAGPYCDGQVQVFHDLLGMFPSLHFRHAKRYAEVGDIIQSSVRAYVEDVRNGTFPTEAHSFTMSADEQARLAEEFRGAPDTRPAAQLETGT